MVATSTPMDKEIAELGAQVGALAVPYGSNNHHIAEAIFKAVARALRQAVTVDPRAANDVPCT
jgi:imidazoleglycerol phosphate dehydratase HisB